MPHSSEFACLDLELFTKPSKFGVLRDHQQQSVEQLRFLGSKSNWGANFKTTELD